MIDRETAAFKYALQGGFDRLKSDRRRRGEGQIEAPADQKNIFYRNAIYAASDRMEPVATQPV